MFKIHKSALFKKQFFDFTQNYKNIADLKIADRFIDSVQDATKFIAKSPKACAVYNEAHIEDKLKIYEFRKWRIKGFPFSIFFSFEDEHTILLEAIYAHKMDIANRFSTERH